MRTPKPWKRWVLLILLFMFNIPMQEKLVCEFDDGDRMIIRQDYTFTLLALLLRGGGPKNYNSHYARVFYKPKYWLEGWKEIDGYSPSSPGFTGGDSTDRSNRIEYCSNYFKIGEVITAGGNYKLPGGGWQGSLYQRGYFKEGFHELNKKMEEMKLSRAKGSAFDQIDASTLLYEEPLSPCSISRVSCLVEAVLQSYSHDRGQTWSQLELTQDSKLYELGKPVHEQKGVAQPVNWTGKL